MARELVPVIHREDGAERAAPHISRVQSERRVCARAPWHDEQARRVRVLGGRERQGAMGGVCGRKGGGDAGFGDMYRRLVESTSQET